LRLVDTLVEQRLLEDILDASKPVVPEECQGLWPNSRPIRGSRARGDDFERGQRFKTATAVMGWFADCPLSGGLRGEADVVGLAKCGRKQNAAPATKFWASEAVRPRLGRLEPNRLGPIAYCLLFRQASSREALSLTSTGAPVSARTAGHSPVQPMIAVIRKMTFTNPSRDRSTSKPTFFKQTLRDVTN
jgi:hypothetical protein